MSDLRDTITAVSTPIGEGGIGIVRLSGKKALSIADKVFVSKDGRRPSVFKTHTIRYGHVVGVKRSTNRKLSLKNTGVIDEVLLSVMRAPATYTREDIIEINCHGGIVALRRILEEVLKAGARLAEPGEFTKRAFLNGRIDLAQAEAVCDVVKAKTEASLKVAVGQLEGGFSVEIEKLREGLLELLRDVEVQIDFQEENIADIDKDVIIEGIEKSCNKINSILETQGLGMILKEWLMCVICGKPNTGKSSLMNALLRRNRAIVTHMPGTTRDAIEESISIKGIPLRIVDTAGIVKTNNLVEKKGIEKTKSYLKKADMAIFMLDQSRPFDKKDANIMKELALDKALVVSNKSDLKQKLNLKAIEKKIGIKIPSISVLKKRNLNVIEDALVKKIWGGKVMHPEAAFLTNIRHKNELNSALKHLRPAARALKNGSSWEFIALDIREAIFHLGLIIGKSIDIDVLDRIFENFCIGK